MLLFRSCQIGQTSQLPFRVRFLFSFPSCNCLASLKIIYVIRKKYVICNQSLSVAGSSPTPSKTRPYHLQPKKRTLASG